MSGLTEAYISKKKEKEKEKACVKPAMKAPVNLVFIEVVFLK
jgi:hypothetical protein